MVTHAQMTEPRRYNPAMQADGDQVTSARLRPGNVLYVMRTDTYALESLTVDRLEITQEGALLAWLRPATTGEFEARQAEPRRRAGPSAATRWRKIARRLAERLSHYEECPHRGQHPAAMGDGDCPFCDDAAAYADYLAAGGRDYRAGFIPAGRPVTVTELVRGEPDVPGAREAIAELVRLGEDPGEADNAAAFAMRDGSHHCRDHYVAYDAQSRTFTTGPIIVARPDSERTI